MKKYHQGVIEFFGLDWFNKEWVAFCQKRIKYSKTSFSQTILKLELDMHPLLKEVFRWQNNYSGNLDFTKIPEKGASDFIFSHLGRDLELLGDEIKDRGNNIKRDLLSPENHESNRFNLLVASGYKLLGYKVTFIPSSPDKKTPDLLVQKGIREYYIESKQRNQEISDKNAYLFFGELVEKYLPLFALKGNSDLLLDIQVFTDPEPYKKDIDKEISQQIWRNQKSKDSSHFKVSLFKATSNPDLIALLKSGGHFQNVPVFTRTEDMFIASDPKTGNVIGMTKAIKEEKIPSNSYKELFDANLHDKKEKKLLVYYDFGRGFSSWTDNLAKQTFEEYNEVATQLKNIDGFVFCQTLLKYKGSITEIRPTFNIIGNKDKLGGTPDELELFGYQGKTGMDNYLLGEFVS